MILERENVDYLSDENEEDFDAVYENQKFFYLRY